MHVWIASAASTARHVAVSSSRRFEFCRGRQTQPCHFLIREALRVVFAGTAAGLRLAAAMLASDAAHHDLRCYPTDATPSETSVSTTSAGSHAFAKREERAASHMSFSVALA